MSIKVEAHLNKGRLDYLRIIVLSVSEGFAQFTVYYSVFIDTGRDLVCSEEEHLNQHRAVFTIEKLLVSCTSRVFFDNLLYWSL